MDLLFICRDASASSLLSNLAVAIEAKKAGKEVGVLFTQEALAALAGGVFLWPVGLQGQELRLAMADNGRQMGFPLLGRGEGRQLHAAAFMDMAREAGVAMFACPLWSGLLGAREKLPPGVKAIDLPAALNALSGAKRVIGSF